MDQNSMPSDAAVPTSTHHMTIPADAQESPHLQAALDASAAYAIPLLHPTVEGNGPGTPSARLNWLLRQLEGRFPGAVSMFSSEPPEPLLLKALDDALGETPWACGDCGSVEGFTTVRYPEGDCDVKCNKCKSVNTGEYSNIIQDLVHRLEPFEETPSPPYVRNLLEAKGRNTDEVWQSIIAHNGSVQHLDFLSPDEKAVFRTAAEVLRDMNLPPESPKAGE